MSEHSSTTWPDEFQAVWEGKKTFELGSNKRGFALGDILTLREYTVKGGYSGREIKAITTFILHGGESGLPSDLCIMNLRVFEKAEGLKAPECTECQRKYVNGRCPQCHHSR